MPTPPAPLFRDPIYDGTADPTIIWNKQEKAWWLLYTRSADAAHWERQADILAEPGTRADDATNGLHADVLVQGERAYIFYFTHPDRQSPAEPADPHPLSFKRTSIQVAELEMRDGVLVCDRNKPFDIRLE